MFDRLNARFFDGALRVPLTWGRGSGRARRGGLTFGSYDPVLALIRIHPVLDRRDVPQLLPGERRLPRDAPPPPGRHPRPRRAHRLPLARLPRGRGALSLAPPGAGLGEGATFRTCSAPARPGPRSARREARGPPAALEAAAPPPAAPPVPRRATGGRSPSGSAACSLRTALLRRLALGAAPRHRRPHPGVTAAEALALRRARSSGIVAVEGVLPLPDAA